MAPWRLAFAQDAGDLHPLYPDAPATGFKAGFDVRSARQQMPLAGRPFFEWTFPDGTVWAQFYRTGSDYLIRFPDLADFAVSCNGEEVVGYPTTEVTGETLDHLYVNQIMPLALSRQFKLVLHASAVEVGDFGIAFLGLSGRGKSTLAASFARSSYRFLTDDGLQLEKGDSGYFVKPSLPSIRLWDDSRHAVMPKNARAARRVSYNDKSRLFADIETYCDVERPLRCMYFLGEGKADKVVIEPVNGRDAMVRLIQHSFLLDVEERKMLMHHFAQLTELARIPMFFHLDYPRRYQMLPDVREAIIQHAKALD